MGTSNSYGGPAGGTPLVPSWVDSDDSSAADQGRGDPIDAQDAPVANPDKEDNRPSTPEVPIAIPLPQDRFRQSRSNFTRFIKSGGGNKAALGRAVASYVSTSSGGSRTASRRMGSSRRVTSRLIGFLNTVRTEGTRAAYEKYNLQDLIGKPIEEVFIGLMDYICPPGGNVDEGIARNAFIETIADLAGQGIVSLENLSAEQLQTVIEMYATHAIEARLCNDIGTKISIASQNLAQFEIVQQQLHDYISRSVSDAMSPHASNLTTLTSSDTSKFVDQIYQEAFTILQTIGENESEIE